MRIALLTLLTACSTGRDVGGYAGIENRSSAGLSVEDGGMGSRSQIDVDCDGRPGTLLTTKIEGDLLIIDTVDGFDASGCLVRTWDPRIESIRVTGDGDLDVIGSLDGLTLVDVQGNGSAHFADVESEDISVSVGGNGEVRFDHLIADSASFDLRGNGDATIIGAARYASFSVTGNGNVDAGDFVVEVLDADVSGSGTVVLHATEEANITTKGNASVQLTGGALLTGDGEVVIF